MPLFTPIGGGGIGKATVTSTTGSPTIDTTSRPGKTIYKFLSGTGSITIGTAGTAEILLVGGGGGHYSGWGAGGGGGGYLYNASAFLAAGTLSVTVGAAGGSTPTNAIGYNGGASRLGDYYALGGGYGGNYVSAPANGGSGGVGGSGGGGANDGSTGYFQGGAGTPGQGYNGAAGWKDQYGSYYHGGGGGAGGNASGLTGGPGVDNSITGTLVTYSRGGNGNGSTAPVANTGTGAYGSNGTGNGSSGIVVVVIG